MSKISFGQRLKALRLQSATPTAQAFADRLGVSRATLYLWEAAEDPPPAKHWPALCHVLGISQKHLLLGQDEPSSRAGGVVEENQTGAVVSYLQGQARRLFDQILLAAGDDPARLVAIISQLTAARVHWKLVEDPDSHPAVQAAVRAAQQNAFTEESRAPRGDDTSRAAGGER